MAITKYQAPEHQGLQRLTVRPSEIRIGDWMRDLGRLRRVESVEPVEDKVIPSTLYTIRFTDDAHGAYPTLGVREAVPLTIWREP
ncbi:hypothetical protein KDK95_00100 [Actinospica sp. MGRD01-02]|uniref:Uncharacterized protein n=1 Tax=Actinospica acidithermotolerans TaxID=2828514 RepID=A0A941E6I6_9ACTN|nr:hypothetical protein [Actinospica acidithermotolerans]MBR7824692.1 hypothetical protein [Actinospica acidithermotolerans]